MLDIKYIRAHPEEIKQNNASRNARVDIDNLLALDEKRRSVQLEMEGLRGTLKKASQRKPSPDEILSLKTIGDDISRLEHSLAELEKQLQELLYAIPNLNHAATPIGANENDNVVIKTAGSKPSFDFAPREHFEIPAVAPHIDVARASQISGPRFYYLKGPIAALERAIMEYALQKIRACGFTLILPPLLVKERAMFGTGFFPADRNEVYKVNPDEDDLYLIGTSEVPLIALHDSDVFDARDLPKKYCSITPCFRREAGSYGKDQRGLLRVHQFYKVEAIVFSTPEESYRIHEEILSIEEEVLAGLDLHYRVVSVCSGDLGYPAAKKYDCEAWMPGQEKYREMTSTSNTTDFQARRLNIKYKTHNPSTKKMEHRLVNTLNGTIATDRAMLALLEQHQTKEGNVRIPPALQPFTGCAEI